MKDLLLYIARNLVEDPDAVSVTEIQGDQELTLELRVAPDDMGKGHRPSGPYRQGDPDFDPLLRPAHRPESFGGYRRLKNSPPDTGGLFSCKAPFPHCSFVKDIVNYSRSLTQKEYLHGTGIHHRR